MASLLPQDIVPTRRRAGSGTQLIAQDTAVVKELSRLENMWAAASLK